MPRFFRISGAFYLVIFACWTTEAHADTIQVVAFGPSITKGKGVHRSQAYPAQLERMLRSRKINAKVTNAGVNGDTTGLMLSRLRSAVPPGTQIVILQPGKNDFRRRISRAKRRSNIRKIRRWLRARNIKVVFIPNPMIGGLPRQFDGIHLTASGYKTLASRILPSVLAAIRDLRGR